MSRKRKIGRKKKKGRHGSKPGGTRTGRGPRPEAERLASADLIPALVRTKLGLLRLTRALDAAGVNPGDHPELPDALATYTGLDSLLTQVVELYDREPLGEDDPVPEELGQMLAVGSGLIARVLDLLPPGLRKRVRRELGRVGAAEPEIWLEVEGLRAAARKAPPVGPTLEPSLEGVRRQHEEAMHLFDVGLPDAPKDERVARQEAKALPRASETSTWLRTLPGAWLRTIARMHRVDPKAKKAELVARIDAAMCDPEGLVTVLAEGLGRRERARLAEFVADFEIEIEDLPDDVRAGLEVPWDWSERLPHGLGGKLRAFGLVYVGTRRGEPTAAVPPELCAPIATALRTADPKGWRSLEPGLRAALQDIVDEAGFYVEGPGDPENREEDDDVPELTEGWLDAVLGVTPDLRRWRDRSDRVMEFVALRLADAEPPEDAASRMLAPLAEVRPLREEDIGYFASLVMYDWRGESGAPTVAEEALAKPEGLGVEERAILKAQCRAYPRLYRVLSVDPGRGIELVDAFAGGSKRRVDAPDLAVGLQPGFLLPARLFRAGTFDLVHLVADPVFSSEADEAVEWLEERFRDYAKAKGTVDREAFLREFPECVSLASLLLVDVDEDEDEDEADEMVDFHLDSPGSRRSSRQRPKRTKPEKVYILDVELVGSHPPVSRRVSVSGRRTLEDLHHILQTAMGWEDCHLHVFEAQKGSWRYGDPQHEVPRAGDESTVTLDEVAARKGSRFVYEYDFGDCWRHEIRVVDRLDPKKAGPEPWCLGGRNACPPEDSGGVGGYAWKLQVLGNPGHFDHEDMREWMGDDYDPTHFDPEEVNRYFRPAVRS